MPRYVIHTSDDQTIANITKDGLPFEESFRFVTVHAISSFYFRISYDVLKTMDGVSDEGALRAAGVHSFLMALMGVEAFTNVYFHLRGLEENRDELVRVALLKKGAFLDRARVLFRLLYDVEIDEADDLFQGLAGLFKLRNGIVHPRWIPSHIEFPQAGVHLRGMVEDTNGIFEDYQFCREAFLLCARYVFRVCNLSGFKVDGFLFHWMGIRHYELGPLLKDLEG